MKNILAEATPRDLHGRLRYSVKFANETYLHEKRVLDVGCGYGWFLVHAIESGANFVAGIEQSEYDLAAALADPQLSKIATLRRGDGLSIPFENDTFHVVTSWEVLEHIPRRTEPQFFSEISRVLSPGGYFFLSTPNDVPINTYLDPAYWLVSHRHYTVKRIRVLAEEAGLEVEEIHVRGAWREMLAIYNLYISKWIFRRRPFFESWQNKKLDEEWSLEQGFTTIMARMRKRDDLGGLNGKR